jgi:RecF/RecN/SMC N terminal domain
MDEIDAALDFRNVSIVANYIKDRTKNAQFIIISLRYVMLMFLTVLAHSPFCNRNDMFELSHRLIGIYKTANATRSRPFTALLESRLIELRTGISIDNHALTAVPLTASSAQ